MQAPYYVNCGNANDPALQRPSVLEVEGDCPAALSASYLGAHAWDGKTLKLPNRSISCRSTDGVKSSELDSLLCYDNQKIEAEGCSWDVHFVTDGILLQWRVAAWADASCDLPKKTCNASAKR